MSSRLLWNGLLESLHYKVKRLPLHRMCSLPLCINEGRYSSGGRTPLQTARHLYSAAVSVIKDSQLHAQTFFSSPCVCVLKTNVFMLL